MADEKKKDYASGEEYAPTAVRRDGLGPTQEQLDAQQRPVSANANGTANGTANANGTAGGGIIGTAAYQNLRTGETRGLDSGTSAATPAVQQTGYTPTQTAASSTQTAYTGQNTLYQPYTDTTPAYDSGAAAAETRERLAGNAPDTAGLQAKADALVKEKSISHLDESTLNGWLDRYQQISDTELRRANNQVDYGVTQGVNNLGRTLEDAQPQYDEQLNQIALDEARARDNQALYAAVQGNRGGIAREQVDIITATAMKNRTAVNTARTKLATDIMRQIQDLRAQGEFQKADNALAATQNYLAQLQQLEQYALQYNLSVDQFNAQLAQWAASYAMELEQMGINYSQWVEQMAQSAESLAYQQWADNRNFDFNKWQTSEANRLNWANYNRGVYESDRAFNYTQGRDAISDARYADELAYNRKWNEDERAYARGRDAVSDARYADELAYSRAWNEDERAYARGRDAVSDARYADELAYSRAWNEDARTYERGRDAASDARAAKSDAYSLASAMLNQGILPDAGTLSAAGIPEGQARLWASNAKNERDLAAEGTRAGIAATKANTAKTLAASTSGSGSGSAQTEKPALSVAQVNTAVKNGELTPAVLDAWEYYHGENYYVSHPEDLSDTAKDRIDNIERRLNLSQSDAMLGEIYKFLYGDMQAGRISEAELQYILLKFGFV